MTDERMGDMLWTALERLPRGSGIVFRHYSLARDARRAVLAQVEKIARRRGLVVVIGGDAVAGRGRYRVHNERYGGRSGTFAVHRRRELVQAGDAWAVFVSPVFATRSHPGARPLGRVRLGLLIRGSRAPVIALGGMNARRARSLKPLGIHGWAAIDAWNRS